MGEFCKNCGHKLETTDQFCTDCGKANPNFVVNSNGPHFCSNCGNSLEDNLRYCTVCGNANPNYNLFSTSYNASNRKNNNHNNQSTSKKTTNSKIFIALIIGIVAVIVLGSILFFTDDSILIDNQTLTTTYFTCQAPNTWTYSTDSDGSDNIYTEDGSLVLNSIYISDSSFDLSSNAFQSEIQTLFDNEGLVPYDNLTIDSYPAFRYYDSTDDTMAVLVYNKYDNGIVMMAYDSEVFEYELVDDTEFLESIEFTF